jgi:hypothetical protein
MKLAFKSVGFDSSDEDGKIIWLFILQIS